MNFLFPTMHKEIEVVNKDSVLERIKNSTEDKKKFRFVFSSHRPFEGKVHQDTFNIEYIGKWARNYKVSIKGSFVENESRNVLRIKLMPTRFGKVYTFIWILFMTFFMGFSLFVTISHEQLIVLSITIVCFLLMAIVLTVSYFGYKHESSKVWSIMEKIIIQNIV